MAFPFNCISAGPFRVRFYTDVTDDLKLNGGFSPMTDTFKQLNAPKLVVFRVDKGHILNVI